MGRVSILGPVMFKTHGISISCLIKRNPQSLHGLDGLRMKRHNPRKGWWPAFILNEKRRPSEDFRNFSSYTDPIRLALRSLLHHVMPGTVRHCCSQHSYPQALRTGSQNCSCGHVTLCLQATTCWKLATGKWQGGSSSAQAEPATWWRVVGRPNWVD